MWNDVANVLVQFEALIVPLHMYAVKVNSVIEFSPKIIHVLYYAKLFNSNNLEYNPANKNNWIINQIERRLEPPIYSTGKFWHRNGHQSPILVSVLEPIIC